MLVLRQQRQFWLLAAAALITLSAGLGLRDPWPPDEPRFALVARDMVHNGEWLFPRRNGELYPDKPPLFMWLIALGYQTTGSLRLAFLLPSLLAGLATLALVTDLARRLWNPRTGLLAGWALLLSFQFCWQSRFAQIDALLVGWTTLGLYGLCRHLLLGPAWGWYAIAWLAMGAGVISKGVGFLPALLLLPWGFAAWRRWRPLPAQRADPRWLLGLLMLVPVLAWLVPMLTAVGEDPQLQAYRDNILHRQTHERFAHAWHHHHPPWYYLTSAPVLWLPLSLLLPWAVPAWWRRLRRGDPRTALLLGFVVLVIAFFSLSPGKRGVYLYPALPAFALALAPLLPGLLRQRALAWTAGVAGALVVGACVLAAPWWQDSLLGALPERSRQRILDEQLDLPALAWIAVALGAVASGWLVWGRLRRALPAFAGLWCCAWTLACWAAWPVLNPARFPAAMMQQAQALAGAEAQLGMVQLREQYVLAAPQGLTTFGYERDGRLAELRDALAWQRAGAQRFLLIRSTVLEFGLFAPERLRSLGRSHGIYWLLAGPEAVIGDP